MKQFRVLLGAAVLIALGAAGGFAGATEETGMAAADIYTDSGYPVTTEKITLRDGGDRPQDLSARGSDQFFDMVEDKTNIHVEWRQIQEEAYRTCCSPRATRTRSSCTRRSTRRTFSPTRRRGCSGR